MCVYRLDSLDFLSRLTARTIFSYLAKCLERFFLPVGQGCINPPAHFVREISTIQTIFCDSIDGVYPLKSARILMKNVLHNNAIST